MVIQATDDRFHGLLIAARGHPANRHHCSAADSAAGSRGSAAGDGAPDGGSATREYSLDELRSMKVRELKALLRAYGVSEVEAVEKEELVEVIFSLQQSATQD